MALFSLVTNRGCRYRHSRCKACCVIATKKARARRVLRDPVGAQRAEWTANLRKNYGIDADDYDSMFKAQGGKCAICKTTTSGKRRFHVDHCHITKIIRGLLCSNCNHGLGQFKDNSDSLRAAISYLEASK